jgi:hypothetical protein
MPKKKKQQPEPMPFINADFPGGNAFTTTARKVVAFILLATFITFCVVSFI